MPTLQKTITPQPEKGELETFFEDQKLNASQKADIKIQALSLEKPKTAFSKNKMNITVLTAEQDGQRLKVECEVDGVQYTGDDCFYFVNPPIKVPDGTYRIEKDPTTNEDIEVPNTIENPAEALQQIIADTLRIIKK